MYTSQWIYPVSRTADAVVAASPILVASPTDRGDWPLPTRLAPGVTLIVPLAMGTGFQCGIIGLAVECLASNLGTLGLKPAKIMIPHATQNSVEIKRVLHIFTVKNILLNQLSHFSLISLNLSQIHNTKVSKATKYLHMGSLQF